MGAEILTCAIVAYGFARFVFPGRNALFAIMLGTMMLPGVVTMIPTYVMYAELKWVNTFYPLIVPAWFGGGAFNIFLLRQFFMGIPRDLDEAAILDGASHATIFWRVILPNAGAALATVGVFCFIYNWRDFMGPLIYVSSPENMPIAYAVQLFQSDRGGEPGLIMAFATMAMLPVLLVFFLAQKYFIEGVQLTGLGGR